MSSEAIRLYWSGLRVNEIATRLSLTRHEVRCILFEAGGRLPYSTTSDEAISRIYEMAQDGASHQEIKRTTGADYRTVQMIAPGTAWPKGGGGLANESRKALQSFAKL